MNYTVSPHGLLINGEWRNGSEKKSMERALRTRSDWRLSWYCEAREHPAMAVSHSVFSSPLNYNDAVCDSVACGTSVTTLALFVVFACDKYAVAVALLGVLLVINC